MIETGIETATRRNDSPEQASADIKSPDEPTLQDAPAFLDTRVIDSKTANNVDPTLPNAGMKQSSATAETSLVNRAVKFVSTATPTTLGGIGVGFAVVTYTLLGQLGLLLIGALGGAVGFIVWESRNPDLVKAIRSEDGAQVLDRIWSDLKNIQAQEGPSEEAANEQNAIKGFDDFRPETREALSGLIDSIIRDYIKWWYNPIVPLDHSFPLACRKTLTAYLLAISNRMYHRRPADAFLDLLTNASSIIIVFMGELAAAFADLPPESNMTAADTVYNYLASNPDSRLANLLNQRQQNAKFKMVAEDLLGFLDKGAYNCDPVRAFLREILATSVLESTLQKCSKAEWINGWIVYLLESGEPNINQAIDVGMQTSRDTSSNIFADLDGNVGNVGIAKPVRGSFDMDRGRQKNLLSHRKKLSKADEELEEAMEEMKRMNAMIAQQDQRRVRTSTTTAPSERSAQSMDLMSREVEAQKRVTTPREASPMSGVDKSSPHDATTNGFSSKLEKAPTPIIPRSTRDSTSQGSSPQQQSGEHHFTSFDQIVPQGQEDMDEDEAPRKAPLTLHNASFTLHDDAPADSGKIRNKPNNDYLIQVEPSSSAYPGWMIVRRYSDFETLHEILRRIAAISGATAFTELHKELPSWKVHTRESLRGELERYLRDACWYQSLAESEGMKRFLEKSQGHTHTNAKTFGWETVGKNMLDVLTTAPKGAMEGGKTLVGGVSGVLGTISGLGRKPTAQSIDLTPSSSRLSISTPPQGSGIMRSPARSERASMDSQRSSVIATQPGKIAPMERRPSYQSQGESEMESFRVGRAERMDSAPASARPSREHSRASSLAPVRSPSSVSLDMTKLPPPPDEITDDYASPLNGGDVRTKTGEGVGGDQHGRSNSMPTISTTLGKKAAPKQAKQFSQLSEPETRVAVELIFAVINEMYTLSSAWNIRRTLLTAAKSFLLRPGNPSLLTVQSLIQSSVLDANTSDAGIAATLRKLRENTMPTEQELAAWPAELSPEETEQLAAKARKLLIQSGVPAALMGVMGQSATGEALGRVFDCLQIEEVARGLVFGLMLQAARVLTH